VLLLCVGSGRTPGRVNGPPRFPRKATGVVHHLSISPRVIRPLNEAHVPGERFPVVLDNGNMSWVNPDRHCRRERFI
jgi:hypothetical protein